MHAMPSPKKLAAILFSTLLLILLISPLIAQANCIGVVTAGGGVDFWQKIEQGALQAGKDHNIKVIVRGPIDEADVRNQQLIIEQMISMGCKGLVLAPNSKDRILEVELLAKKGIPTVFIDRCFDYQDVTTVETDNFKAGELAAKSIIKQLKPNAKIAIFRFDKQVNSTTKREQGFITEIRRRGLTITIDEYLGTDMSESSVKAYQILSDNPDIDGIFTPNESTTLTLLNMRKRLTGGELMVQIGFDSHPSFKDSIESGELSGVLIQKPYEIGYKGVSSVLSLVNNDSIPQKIYTPVTLITKENLEDFSSQEKVP